MNELRLRINHKRVKCIIKRGMDENDAEVSEHIAALTAVLDFNLNFILRPILHLFLMLVSRCLFILTHCTHSSSVTGIQCVHGR